MEKDEIVIDFQEILWTIKLKLRHIVLISIIVGVLTFLVSALVISPEYTSHIDIYVTNVSSDESSDKVNVNDINAAQKLVNTYKIILQTDYVTHSVIEKCDLNISNSGLLDMLSFSTRDNTEVLRITATTGDPFLSAKICNEYASIAPEVIQDIIQGGSVKILNEAKPNGTPASPNIKLYTLAGFIIGFLGAAIFFIVVNILDNTVKDEEALNNKCDTSVLGTVPDFFSLKDVKIPNSVRSINKKHASQKNFNKQKLITEYTMLSSNSPFIITEAYNLIRTNLMFSLATASNKIVVISSALPNECKTTTSANIAISLASSGSKVLLIDGDLRNPTLHKIFHKSNKNGLSRILAGFDQFDDVVSNDIRPNLDILTAGPTPPNVSSLIESENMDNLLKYAEQHYDYVFIDSPPINIVADAMVFSKRAAGIIMITREGWTKYSNLNKAISRVEKTQTNLLGVIITASARMSGGYGYGYGYGYGNQS